MLTSAPNINSLIDNAAPVTDVAQVLHFLHPNSTFELRIIGQKGVKAVGTWDNPGLAARAIQQSYDGNFNCYVTLNSINGATQNRFTNGSKGAIKDQDITDRRWLLIDLDPKRESKTAATDGELQAAGELAVKISGWLGWQAGAIGMSGNGYHLLYRLDMPNTPETTAAIRALLDMISKRFRNPDVDVDKTVYNPGRITKLYGTLSTKGENTPERPFRRSVLYPLSNPQIVTLADIVNVLPPTTQTTLSNQKHHLTDNTTSAIISGENKKTSTTSRDIADYLRCLSSARADNYQDWITVGMALHHDLGTAGLALWETFSQRSPKYTEGECAKRWNSFGNKASGQPVSLRTIYKWAQEDSPTIYNELTKSNAYTDKVTRQGHAASPTITTATMNGDEVLPPSPDCPFVGLKRLRAAYEGQDLGDGELFGELFQERVVYDHTNKQWYLWDGNYWQEDTKAQIKLLFARSISQQYILGAAAAKKGGVDVLIQLAGMENQDGDEKRLKSQKKWFEYLEKIFLERAKSRQCKTGSANALDFAASCLPFTGVWDSDPYLLGVENCVVELKTGIGRKGRPSDYIRTIAPVTWTGLDTKAQRFEKFIREIMGEGHTEQTPLSDFLHRLLGYATAGVTTEHIFPIFWGEDGRNGKDTLLETLQGVLGAYASTISKDVLLKTRQNGAGQATPHVMQLQGKRLVWASEPDEGAQIDAGMLKLFSGGGEVNGRGLYRNNDTFKQTALVLLVTNPKPRVNADDSALWERLILIPFNQRFLTNPDPTKPNEHKADKGLKETLDKEGSGILAWLVRGFLAWQEHGLNIPRVVQHASGNYRQEEDHLATWLEECCIIAPNAQTKGSALCASYKAWSTANGLQEFSGVVFGKKLKRRFNHRKSNGIWYEGVSLVEN